MQQYLTACGDSFVMMLGMSFVLGSLTTVFLLVLLEMYRCYSQDSKK